MKSITLAAALITMFGMSAPTLACGGDTTTKPKPVGERMACGGDTTTKPKLVGERLACDGDTAKKPKSTGERMACSAQEDSCKADKTPPKA